jgi:hypothetical protein
MKDKEKLSQWLLTLADCEARIRDFGCPDIANELRDLRWEMRDTLAERKEKK